MWHVIVWIFSFIVAKTTGIKPLNKKRHPTDENAPVIEVSGVNLEQIDYPENEVFDENIQVSEILEGLNWYAKFQIDVMRKNRKKDNINSVFIDKLNHEMEQSKYVIYRAFA